MMHEKVLFMTARILSVLFIAGLIYLHFCGWFYPKQTIVSQTRSYLLESGYTEEDIVEIKAHYDYKASDNKYYVTVEIRDNNGEIVTERFSYDVEENIYKLGEK